MKKVENPRGLRMSRFVKHSTPIDAHNRSIVGDFDDHKYVYSRILTYTHCQLYAFLLTPSLQVNSQYSRMEPHRVSIF